MAKLETTTATAPAHWVSYLINGDASGFDYYNTPDDAAGDRDMAECDAWTERLAADHWYVVDVVGDSECFRHSNDAGTLAGDVVSYVLHKRYPTGYVHTKQVRPDGSLDSLLTVSVDYKVAPLDARRMTTRTGYGSRIPTQYMVRFNDRWRRVYCAIYSNSGTLFIGRKLNNNGECLIVKVDVGAW